MKHVIKGKKLGRHASSRKALLKSLSVAIIKAGSIETTLVKAKYVKSHFEKLLTKARKNDLATRRYLIEKLQDKVAVEKLLSEIAPLFENRPGGYTRIQRTIVRVGDAAQMAKLSLVEMPAKKSAKSKSTKVEKKEDAKDVKPVKEEKKKESKKETKVKSEKKEGDK